MSKHPLNLLFRFCLELAMLAALGVVGWSMAEGAWRYVLAIGLPLIAAVPWGVFRVPNDGGAPVVQVPGVVRLLLELVIFGAAVVGLYATGKQPWAALLALLVGLHYALSLDRVRWLLSGAPSSPAG